MMAKWLNRPSGDPEHESSIPMQAKRILPNRKCFDTVADFRKSGMRDGAMAKSATWLFEVH